MIGKEVKGYTPVSLSEVEEILVKQEKSYTLTYEQDASLKHAKKFALDSAKTKKLREKLEASVKLSAETLVRIVDTRPKSVVMLKQLLIHSRESLSEEELATVISIIKESS